MRTKKQMQLARSACLPKHFALRLPLRHAVQVCSAITIGNLLFNLFEKKARLAWAFSFGFLGRR
jgi:hypothetical protein